ncbi:hypothetical protein D9758_018354 [Tetrapyrgos nigripes]|uniref:Uncharacterized protein n=1 Tax=Tetrapyrgos nigripes TaxID=182062 RepID=A0A8H5BIG9_9AGAR|nr:hypothetical protein D9758_018354 [Tetrapyrgos nigripes]
MLNQYEDAKLMLQQAREQFEGVGDRQGAAHCLCSLGKFDHKEGHLIEAKAKFEKAKEGFEAIQMLPWAAHCIDRLQQINDTLPVAEENQAQSEEVGSL